MRNFHSISHSGCTSLHSSSKAQRFPFLHIFANTCYFLWYFLFLFCVVGFFFIIAILICVRWYLIVNLTCISLIVSDIEHVFIYLLEICIFSLEKCLIQIPCPFFVWSLFLLFYKFPYQHLTDFDMLHIFYQPINIKVLI